MSLFSPCVVQSGNHRPRNASSLLRAPWRLPHKNTHTHTHTLRHTSHVSHPALPWVLLQRRICLVLSSLSEASVSSSSALGGSRRRVEPSPVIAMLPAPSTHSASRRAAATITLSDHGGGGESSIRLNIQNHKHAQNTSIDFFFISRLFFFSPWSNFDSEHFYICNVEFIDSLPLFLSCVCVLLIQIIHCRVVVDCICTCTCKGESMF